MPKPPFDVFLLARFSSFIAEFKLLTAGEQVTIVAFLIERFNISRSLIDARLE